MRKRSLRGLCVALLMILTVALAAAFLLPAVPARVSAAAAAEPALPQASAGDISNGWEEVFQVPPYPNGQPFHFYGMIFANRNVGFAFGGQTWDAPDLDANKNVINPGRVYRTKDGGKTWQLVFENRGWKIGMACADEKTCWVGGKGGQIYVTYTGGDSWTTTNEYTWTGMEKWPTPPVPTPTPFSAWIRSASIAPGGKPILFGATDNTILRSDDGTNFYNYWPMLSWWSATWSVACPSATICYGGQINRFIVKSTNGGQTWSMPAYASDATSNCLQDKYPHPDPNAQDGIQHRYYGLAFLDEKYGWAVGSCGMIFRTRNGAESRWERQMPDLSEEVQLRRVQAFSQKSAVAVGGKNPDPADASHSQNAVVYRTLDGVNWAEVAAPDTVELHGLAGFADATFVADWSGKIWRWDGELAPVPAATNTPTATPTPTESATATPTSSPTPTATTSAAEIEVIAFHDVNLNEQADESDAFLAGVGIELSRSATPVATGVTGSDGRKVFGGLEAGVYKLVITTPAPGYMPNDPRRDVGVVEGARVAVSFSHRMSTVTATPARVYLPLTLH